MFAVLGDIEFELITYWDGFESTFGVDYAEHSRIEGKPGLQFVGEQLDEFRISLVFHSLYCTPDNELSRLRRAMRAHQALALVFGNGDYRGWFVITAVTASSQQTDSSGNVMAMTAEVTLREYIGDPKSPQKPPAINSAIPGTGVVTSAITKPSGMAQSVRDAVSYAKKAQSALTTAASTVRAVQKMATNPTVALTRIPGLMSQIGGVTAPLTASIPALNAVKESFPDAVRLARDTGQAATFVAAARQSLAGVDSRNLAAALNTVSGQFDAAGVLLKNNSPALSKMTSTIVARKA
ncbi:phage tail protein [Pectobacterium brasiliense]|uniref:phage tail protein n=1 Tax=Pectobacterium brasiliense TaxID=180957 RepID=UPI00057FD258|nr:phage tail protein [Pectobacterium brasiliense]KHS67353.1 phage P2 GpU family protein [Pectobacterium brasiliense]MBN3250565.1 phage tail protein [Pectobacterium brasiliense]MBN3258332.1 phage tail protein [Pectobacterium brasiliense]